MFRLYWKIKTTPCAYWGHLFEHLLESTYDGDPMFRRDSKEKQIRIIRLPCWISVIDVQLLRLHKGSIIFQLFFTQLILFLKHFLTRVKNVYTLRIHVILVKSTPSILEISSTFYQHFLIWIIVAMKMPQGIGNIVKLHNTNNNMKRLRLGYDQPLRKRKPQ